MEVRIDFNQSWTAARRFMETYNVREAKRMKNGKRIRDLKKELRKEHFQLVRVMLLLYTRQAGEFSLDGSGLPSFRTFHSSLAKVLECTVATIRNLSDRLLDAGAITRRTFTGRAQLYEFHPRLVMLSTDTAYLNGVGVDDLDASSLPDSPDSFRQSKTFPPLEERKNKKNKSSCGQLPGDGCHTSPMKSPIFKPQNTGAGEANEPVGGPVSVFANGGQCDEGFPCQEGESGEDGGPTLNRGGAAKPLFDDPKAFQDYGTRLLSQVVCSLYHRIEYLSASQLVPIKRFFIEEFRGKPKEEYPAIYYRLSTRIQIASEWLGRDPNRYIPIPSRYFDRSNPHGFVKTEEWLGDMKASTEKAQEYRQRYSTLMKAWGGFMHTVGSAVRGGGFSGYMKGKRMLEGKYGNLAAAYDYVMLSLVQPGNQT